MAATATATPILTVVPNDASANPAALSLAPAPIVAPDPLAGLTGKQKAAVLMLQLGREESAKVLGRLDEDELEELSAEIVRMGKVPTEVSVAVLAEFAGELATGATTRGGMDQAREMLIRALGDKRAGAILERLSASIVELPFSFMQNLDSRQIVSFLGDEHPQTIALVLAHLPAPLAAAILTGLPREQQSDVAHRIAVMDRTSPDLIRKVESSLERRISSLGVASELASAVGGVRPLVEIINRADRGTERQILEGLELHDADLADEVRSQMFMFEDLVGLEDRAIQLVLRQIQAADLATALKGVAANVRDRVMQNMSERAALTLAEEIDVLGPVRIQVVEEAQANVVRVIRELEESGQIQVRRGDEEEFVA
ncbi:flagellar motor switch protein FliG [Jatrophihabitans sp. GAS493]|uniref:flagellar motor switch protein FliG n=1 Tax=Jatrophihabitans sp. GAS493 TaxID=1907575 RepID=UPI000BB927E3|nr:flagellar motor switch protein FliG [Jatrophihabitans sp. GAS493]SOD71337.1 flagellar motor switch protein FliG [Jatrophihabitans sp. GAS493]